MLVSVHIPFSQAARVRRFAETGDASDGRVYVVDTNELDETQRAHLLRMVSRGETARSIFSEPDGEVPYNVYLTTYEPAPNIARVTCSVRYLDPNLAGDAQLLRAIGNGATEEEIVQLALTGDIERWRVALTFTRARLDALVNAWKYEVCSLIQRLHDLEDPLTIAQVKHYKVEAPQWFDDVVRAGDVVALNLWRQLVDSYKEARDRLAE